MAPFTIACAVFSVAHAADLDESSMLQMPVVAAAQDECRCPGYYEAECTAEAAQGCVWSDQGSSNKPWCQCIGVSHDVVINPVTLPPPPTTAIPLPVTAPPVIVTLPPQPVPDYDCQTCSLLATSMGLEIGGAGFAFIGDYGVNGCYTYTSGQYGCHAYCVNGATVAEAAENLSSSDLDRGRVRLDDPEVSGQCSPPVTLPPVTPSATNLEFIRPIDGTAIYYEVDGVKYWVRSCTMCDDSTDPTPCSTFISVEQSYIDALQTDGGLASIPSNDGIAGTQFECLQHPLYVPVSEPPIAAFAWQASGTLAQLEATIQEYPLSEWTYGVQYNHGWGDVHDIVINSWNRGIRVSATPFYPQGDNAAALNFGTTVFTRDTDGQTAGDWVQNYYQDDEPVHSNGVNNGIPVFRRMLPHAWQDVGTLADLESEVGQYPFAEWTYGVSYNGGWGDVHDVVINSWNRGIRVSASPFYPQGDNAEALNFGTTVFTRDTDGQTAGQWIQNYYQDGVPVHSNGVSDGVRLFRQRLSTAWESAGTLAQLESEVAQYPFTEWTYGVTYNHGWGDVHDIVLNSWNRGIRVSATPFYPQGDNAEALAFGTTVFTRDTDGQTAGEWIQNYYQNDVPVHSNGVSNGVQVFRRRLPTVWQDVGTLADLESESTQNPFTEWTYGVQYNHGWGDVHDIVINSWNRGIRVSVTPFYPQGDNAADLDFGTTVFTRDTDGQTAGEWIQNYYQSGLPVHSNGNSDGTRLFRRRLHG